ncbi:ABC transporter ATP-binding protein [Arthrobacter sp. B0490]|uniref:ABC transporter ATP-binding protein n=1 Tax=Arthrobacter sp. B0490 TaxID=2058891 RepID=UPI000CE4DFF3|nr:ABC transporter ATP-binding protein [Arthrobacter sp. B0490]
MQHALELRDLTKRYGTRTALDTVSLTVPPGSVVGVIGPNGAGKTTTMRLILGLIRPSGGSATVLGADPWRAGPGLRRRIGYLPGELRLDSRITGADLLEHFGRISGPVDGRFRSGLVDRLGLDPSRRVGTLSKGNKQKLGLVQAFMHRPELLVLDEPTSGLDPLVQREFLALVREAKAGGQAVFLSSHVISEVQHGADHVAVLREGHLVRSARVADLRDEAPRSVRLELDHALTEAQARALDRAGLEILAMEEAQGPAGGRVVVEGRVSGSPAALIPLVAELAPRDVVIEEPDLEQAVLGLYGRPGPVHAGVRHG